MLGKHYLCAVVTEEEANGQHVQESGNTNGSRRELSWMTPRACEAEKPPMGVDKRHQGLTHQVTHQWATPHSNCTTGVGTQGRQGGANLQTQANGKLNPRWVETLMGLPVGWVMPSCVSPVTIAPTNCDSSATESSPPQQNELFEC